MSEKETCNTVSDCQKKIKAKIKAISDVERRIQEEHDHLEAIKNKDYTWDVRSKLLENPYEIGFVFDILSGDEIENKPQNIDMAIDELIETFQKHNLLPKNKEVNS